MLMLRELRKQRGLTMKALGEMVGVAESTISQYETSKREPDFETLLKFGEIFDVSVDYLLRGDIYSGQLEKQKAPSENSESALQQEVRNLVNSLSEEEAEDALDFLLFLLYKREKRQKQGQKVKDSPEEPKG